MLHVSTQLWIFIYHGIPRSCLLMQYSYDDEQLTFFNRPVLGKTLALSCRSFECCWLPACVDKRKIGTVRWCAHSIHGIVLISKCIDFNNVFVKYVGMLMKNLCVGSNLPTSCIYRCITTMSHCHIPPFLRLKFIPQARSGCFLSPISCFSPAQKFPISCHNMKWLTKKNKKKYEQVGNNSIF